MSSTPLSFLSLLPLCFAGMGGNGPCVKEELPGCHVLHPWIHFLFVQMCKSAAPHCQYNQTPELAPSNCNSTLISPLYSLARICTLAAIFVQVTSVGKRNHFSWVEEALCQSSTEEAVCVSNLQRSKSLMLPLIQMPIQINWNLNWDVQSFPKVP